MTLYRILVGSMSNQVLIVSLVCLIRCIVPLAEAHENGSVSEIDSLSEYTPWSSLLEDATLGLVSIDRYTNKSVSCFCNEGSVILKDCQ